MKFSCTQENLNQGLSVVSHIAGKNINLPILSNVLLQAGDNRVLRLTATNLEMAVTCAIRGKVEATGEITVPSRLFADYVALLPKERVDVDQDGEAVSVSCGSYQTRMNGIPASEFPLVPPMERKMTFRLSASAFRKAVGQVLFAVAVNESRPEISGVCFRFVPGAEGIRLVLAATDSYRLSERSLPILEGSGLDEGLSVIVPARAVAETVRILGVFKDGLGLDDSLEIGLGESQVAFRYDAAEIISRTIEGRYPDYRQLVPDSFETEAVVRKEDLQRAVKTASLFSRTGLNDVCFRLSPESGLNLNAVNSQTGEHSVDLDGTVRGREGKVVLNFRYFLDGVGNMDSEAIAIQMVDGNSPVILRPVSPDGTAADGHFYIIMPIRQ